MSRAGLASLKIVTKDTPRIADTSSARSRSFVTGLPSPFSARTDSSPLTPTTRMSASFEASCR